MLIATVIRMSTLIIYINVSLISTDLPWLGDRHCWGFFQIILSCPQHVVSIKTNLYQISDQSKFIYDSLYCQSNDDNDVQFVVTCAY